MTEGGIILNHAGKPQLLVNAEVVKTSDAYLSSGKAIPAPVEIGDQILVELRSGMILGFQPDGHYYKTIMPNSIVLKLGKAPSPILT